VNFDGNYLLARAWAGQLEKTLPEILARSATTNWASQEICESRLGLTDWNRLSVLEDVVRRLHQAPLSTQLDNRRRVEGYRNQVVELRRRMNGAAAVQARGIYQTSLQRSPADFRLHENFAEFLEAVGQVQAATEQWQRVCELLPYHYLGWFQTGRLLARQGRLAEAQAALRQSLALRPDLSEGWLELGKVLAAEGQQNQALEDYKKAERLFPQDYRVYYYMGKALAKMSRGENAIAQYRQAVKLNPEDWESVYALGEELAFAGQTAEARQRFEEVIKLKPGYAMAHLNLGVALAQQGHPGEAAQEFQETLRLDPQNQNARQYLEKLQAR
jgi:tetratricopeptide (TPR) repeat protein